MPTDGIDYFKAVQLTALNNVLKFKYGKSAPDEYYIRRIFAFYSKNFYTPLYKVYELPLHHVLEAYFENIYEGMDDEDLNEIRLELLKTEEQLLAEKSAEQEAEIDTETLLGDLTQEAEAISKKIESMQKNGGTIPLLSNKGDVPLANPLLERTILPEIKINFLKPSELEKDNNSLGLLDEP